MTSFESNDSNVFEVDGVRMEIMVPELVALAIPENKPGANTIVRLRVLITNNTSSPVPFIYDTLIPEIVEPDGQTLSRRELIRRQFGTEKYGCRLVMPGKEKAIVVSLDARLSWQDNLLQLEVLPSSPDYLQIPIEADRSWFFNALLPRTYQLRFTYNSPSGEDLCLDSARGQERRVEAMVTGRLSTPFVNLRLFQLIENNPNAVEVEGICFETVMPERVLTLPQRGHENRTPVQMGIRITNNTTTSLRFNCYDAIVPYMMGVKRGYGMDWLGTAKESNFPLAQPGESVTLFPGASIVCTEDEQCVLLLGIDDGSVWEFGTLNSGTYRIQFEYINNETALKGYDPGKRIENIWTGLVSLPSVEFRLVQP